MLQQCDVEAHVRSFKGFVVTWLGVEREGQPVFAVQSQEELGLIELHAVMLQDFIQQPVTGVIFCARNSVTWVNAVLD